MKHRLLRQKFLIAIWLVVFIVGGYFGYLLFFKSSSDKNPYVLPNNSTQQSLEAAKNQPKEGRQGQTVRDGDLEFTVTKAVCTGERFIGQNAYARAEAEGSFCRLGITVKNVGQTPASLPLASQKALIDGNSEPVPAVPDATQYAQADQTKGYWYEQIPAGQTVSGDLIFGANGIGKLTHAELHAAEGSPGIKFSLQ